MNCSSLNTPGLPLTTEKTRKLFSRPLGKVMKRRQDDPVARLKTKLEVDQGRVKE